jgi:hypothetical protein
VPERTLHLVRHGRTAGSNVCTTSYMPGSNVAIVIASRK